MRSYIKRRRRSLKQGSECHLSGERQKSHKELFKEEEESEGRSGERSVS
jgi:hypothetical protein